MVENLIETDGVKHAQARGWLVLKGSSPANNGIHDRTHFKNGVTFTIEYKSTGKKATPKQRDMAFKLKRAGIPCRCCDNVQDARGFIDAMTELADADGLLFDVRILAKDITSFNP